jgi:peptide/nickel transport system permease protein
VVILWAVSVIVFVATQALPGDTASAILGREATPERLASLRAQLGLGQPVVEQYLNWMGKVLTLQLGDSLASGLPVNDLIAPRLANSLVLMGLAALISTPLALLIGALAAYYRDSAADHATSVVTLALAALPEFVIGIFLVLAFATGWLDLLPAVFVADRAGPIWQDPVQLVLPACTLALAVAPYIVRMMRATMIDVLDSEYVQQARLKGLPEWQVLLRHAAPNAIGPVTQVVALQLAWLAGGAVVVEYLFRFPGIGVALLDAVNNRDLPVVQALTVLIAGFYIAINLGADIIALIANPRVRTAHT